MGARGFAPKPTALRLLQGNPGRRKVSENEIKPQKLPCLIAPQELTTQAQQIWNRLIPELDRIGLVSVVDVEKLKRYCDMLVQWAKVRDFINASGFVYPIKRRLQSGVDKDGIPIFSDVTVCVQQWPQVTIYRTFSAELSRMETAFGMDPSARARIAAMALEGAGSEGEEDPFDAD